MFYIQLIGILAFCILVLSYYKKKESMILTYQITANFAYAIHYFLLGGIAGALTSFIGIFRNILFIKLKNNKVILGSIFILLYLIVTIIFYEDFYSIFPMIANSSYLISMIKGSRKSLLIGGILNSSFWLLYSVFVSSYAGMVTESIIIISNSIHLIKIKNSKR